MSLEQIYTIQYNQQELTTILTLQGHFFVYTPRETVFLVPEMAQKGRLVNWRDASNGDEVSMAEIQKPCVMKHQ